VDKGENVINVGGMIRLVMCNLFDGDDFPLVGKHHCSKHRRIHRLHNIHVSMSKKYIVIKWSVNKFNFD
jgi:hypothetical protein